jgi:hypothetical protein
MLKIVEQTYSLDVYEFCHKYIKKTHIALLHKTHVRTYYQVLERIDNVLEEVCDTVEPLDFIIELIQEYLTEAKEAKTLVEDPLYPYVSTCLNTLQKTLELLLNLSEQFHILIELNMVPFRNHLIRLEREWQDRDVLTTSVDPK